METRFNRQELHVLLDRIPDSDLATARKILRALADPIELALRNTPSDDEPLTAHEQSAWDPDQRRLAGRVPLSHQELLNGLGFSEADLQ